jgi:hypothetical protein
MALRSTFIPRYLRMRMILVREFWKQSRFLFGKKIGELNHSPPDVMPSSFIQYILIALFSSSLNRNSTGLVYRGLFE